MKMENVRMGCLPVDMLRIMVVYVSSRLCFGVSLRETGEWRCQFEAASKAWPVRHVDSVHLIIGPCVCIVMPDNGADGWGKKYKSCSLCYRFQG